LSLSRNTVTQAYAELEAEGYLSSRQGSGSFVSRELPEEQAPRAERDQGTRAIGDPRLLVSSRWAETMKGKGAQGEGFGPPEGLPYDFDPGQGAWDDFPTQLWRRLMARQWRRGWRETMDYGDPGGYRPLREEVAAYLAQARAVRCTPEQVVIVNGTQQALDLLARILLEPGDRVAIENPGYPAARQLFAAHGACLVPVPVDEDGIVVEQLRGSRTRLVVVSPSHQFPTGAVLSLPRRLSLLAWARSEDSLVVEDDYDSGFRFEGRPLASLHGLDDSGSVVYLGSFSKLLFPSLRVGYAVLPPVLVKPFQEAKELTDRQTPILEQQLLAAFLGEGHFEHHVRRMRQLYRERRRALVEALQQRLSGALQVVGASAGMHLMVRILIPMSEYELVARAAAEGVAVYPAAPYYHGPSLSPALLLGYAGMSEEAIHDGVDGLARAVNCS
jgi:GntR family transcriptional regulator/MocR family aminotransferase